MSRRFALIPAAGIGSRTGAAIPKQYLTVAGRPMIAHVLATFAAVPAIERVFVVLANDDRRFDALDLDVAACVAPLRVGGATRDESVVNGLVAMRGVVGDDDWVLVHDAARCGITTSCIESLIDAVNDDPVGGLLALPLDDTVKRQHPIDNGATATVRETVDRRDLWRAQTPQMFRRAMLADAIAAARRRGDVVTDEASAMEAAGHRVLLVPGSPRNFKVTTADDLAMMDVLLRARRDPTPAVRPAPSIATPSR